MKRKIELKEKTVEYTLNLSRRARKMRLAVYCDGAFVVTVPQGMSENMIERFILRKAEWVIGKIDYFRGLPKIFRSTRKDYLENRGKALLLAQERVEHFNRSYGFKYNRINIKDQKTRWGSCSRKGNLNFNYKIALLPERIADYIVVHELCHLKEFNHSPRFWDLVAVAIPDYLEIRRELRNRR